MNFANTSDAVKAAIVASIAALLAALLTSAFSFLIQKQIYDQQHSGERQKAKLNAYIEFQVGARRLPVDMLPYTVFTNKQGGTAKQWPEGW